MPEAMAVATAAAMEAMAAATAEATEVMEAMEVSSPSYESNRG